MIIKASGCGGTNKLVTHLLNSQDNEHVEVHEVSAFISGNLKDALNEASAVSRDTECRKFMLSVILSPPAEENPLIANYEDAASWIEQKMGLPASHASSSFMTRKASDTPISCGAVLIRKKRRQLTRLITRTS